MARRMHDDEVEVDHALARRLVDEQFPQWSRLALQIVEPWGTDNAIWRLGDDLVVRLPRIHWATEQVQKEHTWLPVMARHLTVAVPEPVAIGEPSGGYPFPWAVHRWLPGEGATPDRISDLHRFALDMATVVVELRTVTISGAPPARRRAKPVHEYDRATRDAIAGAAHLVDADAATAIWDAALAAEPHRGEPVWVHGDLEGNCVVDHGRLAGLVDWGSACAGDPAVDVQVVWSPLFSDESRQVFLDAIGADGPAIARSKGAAINQACAALPYYLDTYPLIVERSRHKLAALGVATT